MTYPLFVAQGPQSGPTALSRAALFDRRIRDLVAQGPLFEWPRQLARRGYYAPKKLLDAKAQADEEILQATFSRDELKELPVEVQTQFFKINDLEAQLSVLAHLDLRSLRFRKEEQRNLNELRFITVVFDRDGNYVGGQERDLDLRLRDASLQRLLESRLTVKTSLQVKPGTYLVRAIVRDAEGGQLSALNSTVEIPF